MRTFRNLALRSFEFNVGDPHCPGRQSTAYCNYNNSQVYIIVKTNNNNNSRQMNHKQQILILYAILEEI